MPAGGDGRNPSRHRALTCGFGGVPRGIRTPNRQIRSHRPPVPAHPLCPSASPSSQLNGHAAGRSRASVPACPAPHGRNLVAVSGHRCQTRCLATAWSEACGTPSEILEHQIFRLVLLPSLQRGPTWALGRWPDWTTATLGSPAGHEGAHEGAAAERGRMRGAPGADTRPGSAAPPYQGRASLRA